MLNPFSPRRVAEVYLSRRAEKALLRQARAYWVGTRDGLKRAVRLYVRRHRGQKGLLTDVLRSSAKAAAAALLLLQLYATPVDAALVPAFTAQTGAANPLDGQTIGFFGTPSFVDLDNDGDLDLVSGDYDGLFHYFKNTGTTAAPAFVEQTGTANPLDGKNAGLYSAPSFVDLDNDSDLDLVSGNNGGVFNYFKNTGNSTSPAFANAAAPTANPLNAADVGDRSTPSFVDLDGDGDMDMVSGNTAGEFSYFKNAGPAGEPAFVSQTGTANPLNDADEGDQSTPAFVDLDGDGDMDLVSGERYGSFLYFKNEGTSTTPAFASQGGTANPLNGEGVGYNSTPAFGDIDGDGDRDLISGEKFGSFSYFKNTGTVAVPEYSLNHASLDFGSVTRGQQGDTVTQIHNTGGASLTLSSFSGPSSPFAVGIVNEYDETDNLIQSSVSLGSTVTLAPGHFLVIPFSFNPTGSGTFSGSLSFTTDDADESSGSIDLAGTSPAVPEYAATESSLDFGSVARGTSGDTSTQIRNDGDANLTLSSFSLPNSPFAVGVVNEYDATDALVQSAVSLAGTVTLSPGHFLVIPFSFSPTASGPFSGSLNFTTNDADEASGSIALEGSSPTAPEYETSNSNIGFGSVARGGTGGTSTQISNEGDANLTLSDFSLPISPFAVVVVEEYAANGALVNGAVNLESTVTLEPGHFLVIRVTFSPTASGNFSGSLDFTTNDADESSGSIALEGSSPTVPEYAANRTSLDFGSVAQGQTGSDSLQISNTGDANLTISDFSVSDNHFGTSAAKEYDDSEALVNGAVNLESTVTLAPGHALVITFTFSPTASGTVNGTATFTTNDADEGSGSIDLSGVGVAATAPEYAANKTSLDFGFVAQGQTGADSLQVSNTGDANLTISNFTLSDTHFGTSAAKEYDDSENLVNGAVDLESTVTLAPGHALVITFSFSPTASGTVTGTATFNTNDTDEASGSIDLAGTGYDPAVASSFLKIGAVFSTPGDDAPLSLNLTLIHPTGEAVAGIQFDLDLSHIHSAIPVGPGLTDFLTDLTPNGFQLIASEQGEDTLRVVVFSSNGSLIQPGSESVLLGRLNFTPGTTAGSVDTVRISPTAFRVSNAGGHPLPFGRHDGSLSVITVTLDLNGDNVTDILDIVPLVAELIGRLGHVLPTAPQSLAFQIRDGNNNGALEVGDILVIVNKILGLTAGKAVAGVRRQAYRSAR